MQSHNKIFALITIFFIIPFTFVYPQTQEQSIASFKPVQGLPSKIATSVFKDSRGFMWFGTENGLYRWDGYEFKAFHFDPDDSTSISGNMVWKILFEDTNGKLWIRTYSNELNIYNPNTESFENFKITPCDTLDIDLNNVVDAIQDKDGEIWMINGERSGLINFDRSSGDYRILRPIPDTIDSPCNIITTIFEDSMGDLWIGTLAGLFVFNKKSETFTNLRSICRVSNEFINTDITDIHEDQNNVFWIATTAGLFKYDKKATRMEHFRYDKSDTKSICSDLLMKTFDNPLDGGRSLWIATRIGMNKMDKSTGIVTRFNNKPENPRSQAFDAMFDMFLDDNGMLWTATSYAGAVVYNLNHNPFKSYTIGPFEKDQYLYEATSFLEDNYGNLWVGTGYGGLLKYDIQMNLTARYSPDPENQNSISYY